MTIQKSRRLLNGLFVLGVSLVCIGVSIFMFYISKGLICLLKNMFKLNKKEYE